MHNDYTAFHNVCARKKRLAVPHTLEQPNSLTYTAPLLMQIWSRWHVYLMHMTPHSGLGRHEAHRFQEGRGLLPVLAVLQPHRRSQHPGVAWTPACESVHPYKYVWWWRRDQDKRHPRQPSVAPMKSSYLFHYHIRSDHSSVMHVFTLKFKTSLRRLLSCINVANHIRYSYPSTTNLDVFNWWMLWFSSRAYCAVLLTSRRCAPAHNLVSFVHI